MPILNMFLTAAAIALSIPALVLACECLLAVLPRRSRADGYADLRPQLAVLIPAHNEETVLHETLHSILPELAPGDQILVVADNCDDTTADIARSCGVVVRERNSRDRVGKGYALDFGLRCLAEAAPEVVVMVDADCRLQPGTLERIARQAATLNRPIQAVYLMEQPRQPGPRDLTSALAVMVKNMVRPLGLARAGMPCLLTGSGMAFPWHIVRRVPMATSNLVEDMQLGLDLAIEGYPPVLCQVGRVIGRLPKASDAAMTQRRRWEHGHMRTLLRQGPRLLIEALRQRRVDLLALAMDLCVPPLSLLVITWVAMTAITGAAVPLGASLWALLIVGAIGVVLTASVGTAWWRYGRSTMPLLSLLAIPLYVLWKVPLYLRFLWKPQTAWVRTSRKPG